MKETTRERKQVSGRITVVQEQRFRLTTPQGRGLLFTLGTHATPTMGALSRYMEAQLPVTVEYSGDSTFADGIAHSVTPTGPSR